MRGLVRFILYQFSLSVLMVFLLLTVVFIVLRVIPGDPAVVLFPPDTPPELIDRFRQELGLDKPIHIQYADYLAKIITGDWGRSISMNRPVTSIIASHIGTTIELMLSGLFVGIVLGTLGGLFSAIRKETVLDHTIRMITVAAYALPSFWLALMLQLVLGVNLDILPTDGRIDFLLSPPRVTGLMIVDSLLDMNMAALASSVRHLILPSLTIGIYSTAILSRVTRTEVIEQSMQDYAFVLHAKGLTKSSIFIKHLFRNALMPVMTIIGLQVGVLLGGATITETIFNLQGTGRLLVASFLARDYPMIQGLLVFNAAFLAIIMLVMGVAYYFVDPRIRY